MSVGLVVGFIVGGYTAAMVREEYFFPTLEKIDKSFKIYKKNEEIIAKSQQSSLPQNTSKNQDPPKS